MASNPASAAAWRYSSGVAITASPNTSRRMSSSACQRRRSRSSRGRARITSQRARRPPGASSRAHSCISPNGGPRYCADSISQVRSNVPSASPECSASAHVKLTTSATPAVSLRSRAMSTPTALVVTPTTLAAGVALGQPACLCAGTAAEIDDPRPRLRVGGRRERDGQILRGRGEIGVGAVEQPVVEVISEDDVPGRRDAVVVTGRICGRRAARHGSIIHQVTVAGHSVGCAEAVCGQHAQGAVHVHAPSPCRPGAPARSCRPRRMSSRTPPGATEKASSESSNPGTAIRTP